MIKDHPKEIGNLNGVDGTSRDKANRIVLPQALARTIQPLVNIFIACLIGSSLAAAIGVVELTAVTQRINQERAAGVITFLTSGLTYLAIAFAATKVGGLLERRLEFMGRGRA